MTKTGQDDTRDRMGTGYGAMRGLGVVVGASYNMAKSAGRALVTGPGRIISLLSRRPGQSPQPEATLSVPEAIRALVLEELARMQGAPDRDGLGEFERRLRVMAEAVEALQKRIAELGAGRAVSEADVWNAVDSLPPAESLTQGERALLADVFRQNVVLQKPELIEAGVEAR